MQVETYALKAKNGRHIRMATKVVFPDGFEVKFMDKMPKAEAIRQAENFISKNRGK